MSEERSKRSSRVPGFYTQGREQRFRALGAEGIHFTKEEKLALDEGGLTLKRAENMIENVLGLYSLPFGVALNFRIDHEDLFIPLVVEEPSIVAACSNIAKLSRAGDGFITSSEASVMKGQIQILFNDAFGLNTFKQAFENAKPSLLESANRLCPGLVSRGGGVLALRFRTLPPNARSKYHQGWSSPDTIMGVVELHVDCIDAMGANIINSVCEGMRFELQQRFNIQTHIAILSNLADLRCAEARVEIPLHALAGKESKDSTPDESQRYVEGLQQGHRIVSAYEMALRDPYRACTHNKGIMNGIDGVAVATGNDWRSIEAAAHAYAALSGQYTTLSRFRVSRDEQNLECELRMPMAVGTVGGSILVHEGVRAARALLGARAEKAGELARVMVAVGLAQNIGALHALAGEGIQRGHMSLHIRQVLLEIGAASHEISTLKEQLIATGELNRQAARAALKALRNKDCKEPKDKLVMSKLKREG